MPGLSQIGDIGIALKADHDDFVKSLATAEDSVNLIRGSIGGLAAAARNLGTAMTIGAGIAGGAMALLANQAAEVNEAFREVGTISDQVSNAQEEYGQLVSDINTELGIQASKLEIIEGLYQSVSAGVKEGAESQREFLTVASKLAVVGGTDLATSVDVLSTAINAYGKETEFASRASNALFATVQLGKTRLEELAPTMGRLIALASNLDTNIEQVGASMAILTRTGFESRVAATGLRNVFRSFMKPSEDMKTLLRDIALSQDLYAESAQGTTQEVKDLAQSYRDARSAINRLETAQKQARETQQEASLAIQEARLKITAINQNRLDQLPKLSNEYVKNADSIGELNDLIEKYQFKTNKARVAEVQARQTQKDKQETIKELRKEFKSLEGVQGDLGSNIGQLVVKNQGFISTLETVAKRVKESDVSFSDIIPRTRALQTALTLVGDNADVLREAFNKMRTDGAEAAKEVIKENKDQLDMTADEAEKFASSLGSVDQKYQEFYGASQKAENALSTFNEALTELGRIFKSDVFSQLSSLAERVQGFTDYLRNMDESVRQNISRFALLAVAMGAIIGPLLFIGGQFALIATALGTTLIPILGVLAIAFGFVASSLNTAMKGGEDAQAMFEGMSNVINTLKNKVKLAWTYFQYYLLPSLREIGNISFGIFDEIASNMSSMMEQGSGKFLVDYFVMGREALQSFASFLKNNRDTIVQVFTFIADAVINRLIPALVDVASAAIFLLQNVDWSTILKVAGFIGFLTLQVVDLIGAVARFIEGNQVIAWFVKWGTKIAALVAPILAVVYAIGVLAPIVSGIVSTLSLLSSAGVVGSLVTAFFSVGSAISYVAALFPTLAAGVSAIVSILGTLATVAGTVFSFVAGVISLPALAVAGLIVLATALVAAIWIMRDEIVAAMKNSYKTLKKIGETIYNFLTGKIGWKEAGEKILKLFTEGITENLGSLKKGMKKVAETVASFLPSSPAEQGPLSLGPKTRGAAIPEGLADGMLKGKSKLQWSSEEVAKSATPDTSGQNWENIFPQGKKSTGKTGKKGQKTGEFSTGQEITISDKAVYFEKGAFQGVSDEELPRKVRNVVDKSLDEIVAELEAKGVEVE